MSTPPRHLAPEPAPSNALDRTDRHRRRRDRLFPRSSRATPDRRRHARRVRRLDRDQRDARGRGSRHPSGGRLRPAGTHGAAGAFPFRAGRSSSPAARAASAPRCAERLAATGLQCRRLVAPPARTRSSVARPRAGRPCRHSALDRPSTAFSSATRTFPSSSTMPGSPSARPSRRATRQRSTRRRGPDRRQSAGTDPHLPASLRAASRREERDDRQQHQRARRRADAVPIRSIARRRRAFAPSPIRCAIRRRRRAAGSSDRDPAAVVEIADDREVPSGRMPVGQGGRPDHGGMAKAEPEIWVGQTALLRRLVGVSPSLARTLLKKAAG